MNLLEILDNELKDKHYNTLEKVRYIYLRTCEIFSYDECYYISRNLKDKELHSLIENKKFDVTDINEFQMICFSYAKYILDVLIKELTNADSKVMASPWHAYVVAQINNLEYTLDACIKDFSKVKMNLKTDGFYVGFSNNKKFNKELAEIDNYLGFNLVYESELIDDLKKKNETLLDVFKNINELLKISKCNRYFFDAYNFVNILKNKRVDEGMYTDNNYRSYQLYRLLEDNIYFALDKTSGMYALRELSEEEHFKLRHTLTSY